MAYWYIAHEDELLLDLDNYMRPTRTGAPWGEVFFRRRLRDAISSGKLEVDSVWLVQSYSEKHYQAIVRLHGRMNQIARLVWQLHLGSDLYRGRADLMRSVRMGMGNLRFPPCAASLLIMPRKIPEFYRAPDGECKCTAKHATVEQAHLASIGQGCDVWQHYRGMSPWELFGKNENLPERMVALPLGEVSLRYIMERHLEDDHDANGN